MTLTDLKKAAVLRALVEGDFDIRLAASHLGVNPRTVWRLLARWGLPSPIGGHPGGVLWSERQRRCGLIRKALERLEER